MSVNNLSVEEPTERPNSDLNFAELDDRLRQLATQRMRMEENDPRRDALLRKCMDVSSEMALRRKQAAEAAHK